MIGFLKKKTSSSKYQCWLMKLEALIKIRFAHEHNSDWKDWDDWRAYFDNGSSAEDALEESSRTS